MHVYFVDNYPMNCSLGETRKKSLKVYGGQKYYFVLFIKIIALDFLH